MTRLGSCTSKNANTGAFWRIWKTVRGCDINGECNEAFVPSVASALPKRPDGTIITSTGVSTAAVMTWQTGYCSIPTVIDRFTALITMVHRCVLQGAFETLERFAGKLA